MTARPVSPSPTLGTELERGRASRAGSHGVAPIPPRARRRLPRQARSPAADSRTGSAACGPRPKDGEKAESNMPKYVTNPATRNRDVPPALPPGSLPHKLLAVRHRCRLIARIMSMHCPARRDPWPAAQGCETGPLKGALGSHRRDETRRTCDVIVGRRRPPRRGRIRAIDNRIAGWLRSSRQRTRNRATGQRSGVYQLNLTNSAGFRRRSVVTAEESGYSICPSATGQTARTHRQGKFRNPCSARWRHFFFCATASGGRTTSAPYRLPRAWLTPKAVASRTSCCRRKAMRCCCAVPTVTCRRSLPWPTSTMATCAC